MLRTRKGQLLNLCTHPTSAVGTAVLQAKQKKTAKQFSVAINPFVEYLDIHRCPMCKFDETFQVCSTCSYVYLHGYTQIRDRRGFNPNRVKGLWSVISVL